MKKAILIIAALAFVGCTSKTEHGECIGAFDDKKPNLEYKVSKWNVFVGAAFFEMLFIPPILVVANQTLCPVATKGQ